MSLVAAASAGAATGLAQQLREALAALGGPAPARVDWLDELDSTNARLLAAGTPPPGGAALLAERQSAGRGRQGRRWLAPVGGSLCLSLALPWPQGPASAAGLPLLAGAAVAEVLADLGAQGLSLKWPNDLLLDGAKLGGLLLEFASRGQDFLVLGLGLNLRLPAGFDAGQPSADLASAGIEVERVLLAAQLLRALCASAEDLRRRGLAPLLPRWRRFDALLGCTLEVRAGEQVWVGTAAGIDERGQLRLRLPDGSEQLFGGGELRVRRA